MNLVLSQKADMKRVLRSLSLISLILSQTIVFGQTTNLRAGFQDPPNSARPRVWWHWMNGNITKEGIQKDLEWMKRVGIGGGCIEVCEQRVKVSPDAGDA